ncbi:MAG: sialate O-acetylesterase, partial [bacterium]
SGAAVFNADNGFLSVLHLDEAFKDEAGLVSLTNKGATVGAGVIGKGLHLAAGQSLGCGEVINTYPKKSEPNSTAVWVKPEALNGNIVVWGRGAQQQQVTLTAKNPDTFEMSTFYGPTVTAEGPARIKQWQHVEHTYKLGASLLYVNGVLAASSAASSLDLHAPCRLELGGNNFAGDIDEVRVSKVTRSADWVKLEYENQRPQQTLTGPLVRPGADFAVSPATLSLMEGKSATVTAKAGGAQKIYWIIKQDGAETIAAVDRLTYTLSAGRVIKDTSFTLQLKAVFANGTKTKEIPVTIKEDIPEPAVTLKAPAAWNGRDTIEVVSGISNLAAMKAKGVGEFKTTWSVSGGAVTKEITGGKMILKRAQYSGKITVKLTLNNGGPDSIATASILVTEPKKDAWVQRVPDKNEKPMANQFYARDDNNEGTLFYNGTIEQQADSVFLKVYADGKLLKTDTQKPKADQSYAFTAKLKPGLIHYKVEFGTKTGSNEKVLDTVSNLICGDAYIIEGQSNAEAGVPNNGKPPEEEYFTSEWIRSYGNVLSRDGKGGWGKAVRTMRWGSPNYGDYSIGAWGMMVAKRLLENHRIPICIINGAAGGTPISYHLPNPANRYDVSGDVFSNIHKVYGGLLTRVTEARLTHGIRGVLWHQGENDSGGSYTTYQQDFVDLTAAWKQDYPNIRHYYVFQVWPAPCNMGPKDDQLREVQRKLPRIFSNLRVMSTVGISSPETGRGMCHFDLAGYEQMAALVSPLVELDNYGLKPDEAVTAPNLIRAWFTSAAKNEIALDFGQPMMWKDVMKKELYLDGVKAQVSAGSAAGNVITLKLGAFSAAKTIGYLSGRDWEGKPTNLIYGANGIAALTFCDVPVEDARGK